MLEAQRVGKSLSRSSNMTLTAASSSTAEYFVETMVQQLMANSAYNILRKTGRPAGPAHVDSMVIELRKIMDATTQEDVGQTSTATARPRVGCVHLLLFCCILLSHL